jgi:hypothetical protein
MRDDLQGLRDDIAFMKAVSEDSGLALIRDGAVLVAVGVIFGISALRFWAIEAGYLDWARGSERWMGFDAVAIFLLVLPALMRRFGGVPRGSASRAMSTAWGSVGWAISVAVLALAAGAWRLHQPLLVLWVFPPILFTLYGAAWWIAFSVKRTVWLGGIAGGCFATVIGMGLVMGAPSEWLLLSTGLFLWVAVPGAVIMHQAKG